MKKTVSLTLILMALMSPSAMSMVDQSFCHATHSTCADVCHAWNKTWTGEQDGHVCCQPEGKSCRLWGCFCK